MSNFGAECSGAHILLWKRPTENADALLPPQRSPGELAESHGETLCRRGRPDADIGYEATDLATEQARFPTLSPSGS